MISELLDVRVASLAKVQESQLYLMAVSADGEVTLDAGYEPLETLPCANVVNSKRSRVYDNVTNRFPDADLLKAYDAVTYCGYPVLDGDGNVTAIICLIDDKVHEFSDEDIDLLRILGQRVGMEIERQQYFDKQARADKQMKKLSGAIEQTADAVVITDKEGFIEYVNPAYEAITGYSYDEVKGLSSNVVKSGQQSTEFYDRMWETILNGYVFQDVVINRKKSGELYYEEKTITPLKDEAGNITHFISTGKDITERMQTQQRLYELAYHDMLTELPNRALFVDRLDHALARQRGLDKYMAVLFLDLDRFKVINDSLGHDVGDRALKILANRIVESLRAGDTVARLGGDEFVILLEDVASTEDLAPICRMLLHSMSQPFIVEGHELSVTGSIGISLYPSDGKDASTLLRNADTAMYRAKELRQNSYHFYSVDMSVKAFERLNMETNLRHAHDRQDFLLYYQPVVSIKSNRIIGVEALIRWQHPDFGMVQPGEFVPLLEETGLIVPVGKQVLETALAQAMEWKRMGLAPVRMAINLSSRQFDDASLRESVLALIKDIGVAHECIEFEITESLLMSNNADTLETLRAWSAEGIRLAVDDFGTGYSSLSYLKRFPINTLKIDRSFVRDVTEDPDGAAIVQAIVAMAEALKLDTTAEGVESWEQMAFLRQYCSCFQGYLFSEPLSPDSMTALLRQDNEGCPVRF